jgi:hypothetical protein
MLSATRHQRHGMTETGEVDRERGSPRASAGDYKIHPAGLTTKAAEYTKKQSMADAFSLIPSAT